MSTEPQLTYEIYVDDDRYAVPTLHLVMAEDEAAARAKLQRLLGENGHHRGGEICIDGRVLFRTDSEGLRRRPRPALKDDGRLAG